MGSMIFDIIIIIFAWIVLFFLFYVLPHWKVHKEYE